MRTIVWWLLSVFAGAGLLLIVRGVALKHRKKRDRVRMGELRRRAVNVLGRDGPIPIALARAPRRMQRALILELSRSVGGAEQTAVRRLADELGLSGHALRQCRSRAWWKRLEGARLLTAIRSDSVVVTRLLEDRHALVRAQALEWAGQRDDQPLLWRVTNLLGDASPACRFAAKDTLLRARRAAVPSIKLYLDSHAGPGIAEALEIVPGIAVPELAPAVGRHLSSDDPEIRARAVLALAAIGGGQAIHSIRPLLHDAAPEVRAAAASGLGTLHDLGAASELVKLLHDSVWEVRQRAAFALRSLGAPGELLLRSVLRSDDSDAADVARQALDAPGTLTSYPVIVE